MLIKCFQNKSDASNKNNIKKLYNISTSYENRYLLNGILIGFDLIRVDDSYYDACWIYQKDGKLYCSTIHHYDSGASVRDSYAIFNVAYI